MKMLGWFASSKFSPKLFLVLILLCVHYFHHATIHHYHYIFLMFENLFISTLCFRYIVYGGLPSLIILVKGSEFAKDFLKKYSISTN